MSHAPTTSPSLLTPLPATPGLRRVALGGGQVLWSLSPYDAAGRPRPAVLGALRGLLAEADRGVLRLVLGLEGEAWGPQEERLRLTQSLLELLAGHGAIDLQIHTRASLAGRDTDLLRTLSTRGRVTVAFTIASLEARLNAWLEPGAPSALRRLMAMQALSHAGLMVGLRVSPLLPGMLEATEALLQRAAHAGACFVEFGTPGLSGGLLQSFEAREAQGGTRPRSLRRLHLRTGEAARLRRLLTEKAMGAGLLPLEVELSELAQPSLGFPAKTSQPGGPARTHAPAQAASGDPARSGPRRTAGGAVLWRRQATHTGATQLALFSS